MTAPDFNPEELLARDVAWLKRRRGKVDPEKARARIQRSRVSVAARQENVPEPVYDPDLPITTRREDLLAAIRDHQVIIIAGETGSGKSTQIPKLCLEAGRGVRGRIGCTQPRRIAARSVAQRVAVELDSEPGTLVGWQVRFRENVSPEAYIKFMTDGILLSELHRDRFLDAYDTLIIDEAHERSLNIDFLLGYLKRLLRKRPDLKLIVTSATIDTDKFARHFDGAPVIEVEGRGWPVDIVYQPAKEDGEALDAQIARAVDTLTRIDPRGDILVFLPGEREIFRATKHLRRKLGEGSDILPLYARLPASAQDRIFNPGAGRRIVLATNVAETSLTVPGIRFVIDSGLARISRYASHSKVLRLPVEPVSQAACAQRAGRCGRVGPGTCVRLFDETDFESRPAFTEPEILRTPLAATLLTLLNLRLGEPEDFPFIDPPPRKLINEARHTLVELQALDETGGLTPVGRELARLPVDVRFGRMLLEARDRGVLPQMLILVAGLSVSDPRERPADQQQAADQAHSVFRAGDSDFAGLLKLWRWWHETRRERSNRQAERRARAHFLAPQRLREWGELQAQLRRLAEDEGWALKSTGDEDEAVHRALLSGLLAHIGQHQEDGEYQGARGHKFRIFPGSVLARRKPGWIMAAELVETARPYARTLAPVKPTWLEQQATHLTKHRVFDPHWDRRSGRVMGYEQVSLYGLVLVEKRRVHYGAHDPDTARKLFIRHALVRGEMHHEGEFLKRNAELREALRISEHKRRRRDVLADESELEAFFGRLLPADIFTVKAFARWYLRQDEAARRQLLYDRATLLRPDAAEAAAEAYPDDLDHGGERFRLEYRFDPASGGDGVTLVCPLDRLNRLDPAGLEWLVPGMLADKIAALIGTLPKSRRRSLVPAAEYARAALESLEPGEGDLFSALAAELSRMTGLDLTAADFDPQRLPDYLRMNLRVTGDDGTILNEGRDIAAIQQRLEDRARAAFMARHSGGFQRDGISRWDFGELPEQVETGGGHPAWPALVDQGEVAGLRVFDDPDEAAARHRAGVACLLRRVLSDKFKYLTKNPELSDRVCLAYAGIGDCRELAGHLRQAALSSWLEETWPIRTPEAFAARVDAVRRGIVAAYRDLAALTSRIVLAWWSVHAELAQLEMGLTGAVEDIESQLEDLIYHGFVCDVPVDRLADYPRYLEGVALRIERMRDNPGQDARRQAEVEPWWHRYLEHLGETGWYTEALDEYRWLVEEYRIQVFAQSLGTRGKVSEKRLDQAWRDVQAFENMSGRQGWAAQRSEVK